MQDRQAASGDSSPSSVVTAIHATHASFDIWPAAPAQMEEARAFAAALIGDDIVTPETLAWIVAFDIPTYLEAVTALALIASAVRVRAIRVLLHNILPRRLGRTGRRESRSSGTSSPRTLKADNDNDEDSRRQAA